jgi:hypothetical protein
MIALLRHSWQPLNLEYERTHNAWHFADQRVIAVIAVRRMADGMSGDYADNNGQP